MRGPRIGVTTKRLQGRDPLGRPQMGTEAAYLRAVWAAGGLPVMFPNLPPEAAPACLEGVEGVLLTGGGDIDPARYGAPRHPQTDGVDPERDAFEFALVEAARAQGKPILGICRGSQVLAVAFGAALCQHLPDITELTHDSKAPPPARAHPVRLESPPELEALLRAHGIGEILEVNSYHHQGVSPSGGAPPASPAHRRGTGRRGGSVPLALGVRDDRSPGCAMAPGVAL
jgi:putative glutamine amidotransferase